VFARREDHTPFQRESGHTGDDLELTKSNPDGPGGLECPISAARSRPRPTKLVPDGGRGLVSQTV
jgi:hypothetical protein